MQLLRPLKPGVFIMLFRISPTFATTMKQVLKIVGTAEDGRYIVQEKNNRKSCYLELRKDIIMLEGEHAVGRDGDYGGVINGNGCFNLVAESTEELKSILENKSLTVIPEPVKARILFYPRNLMSGPDATTLDGQVLYPEILSGHSVINQLKRKQQYGLS